MRYLRLLNRPETFLLWAGQMTSVAGDRLYAMAVLWLVLQLTGSTELMAVVALGQSVPLVAVGLLGGGLIDRWDKFRGMVWIDTTRAVLVLILPVIYLTGQLAPWHFLIIGIGLGSLEALFTPSLQSVLPAVVDPEDLQGVIGLMDTTSRLAQVLGPGSAGILLALLPQVHFFTLDAVSFAVSAATLAWVGARYRRRATPIPPRARPRLVDWRGGLDAIRADRPLSIGISLRVFCNAALPAYTLGAPLLVVARFHDGIGAYGLIIGAYGAGSLAGNLLAGNAQFGRRVLAVFCLSWGLLGVALTVFGTAPSFWLAIVATLCMGAFGSTQHVSMELTIARTVPRTSLGKVYAFQRVAMAAATSLGTLAVGFLLAHLDVGAALPIAGLWMAVGASVALVLVGKSGLPVLPPWTFRRANTIVAAEPTTES